MSCVKVTISVPEALFQKAEALAKEQGTSRSELFARAMEEHIKREKARKMLEQANEAWADGLTDEERSVMDGMRRLHRKAAEGEW